MTPAWDTALTRALGLRLPILAGGLQWLADSDYVTAAARAGIMGFITAASHADTADLRTEIARAHRACDGLPFGHAAV